MDVLARLQAGGQAIECGRATTRQERAAVLAQRFRVYQRRGYYRPGLRVDRDHWDRNAIYFLALLRDEHDGGVLLGSSRLIIGESVPGFRFPTEENFQLGLPAAMRESALSERAEISRVVVEGTHGIVIGGLLTPLGLLQAMVEYGKPRGIRCGFAGIEQRLLRALQSAGVCVHAIEPAKLIAPGDCPMSGYFYHHADPVIPTYWLTDEVVPSIKRAIARYHSRCSSSSLVRNPPTATCTTAGPESTRTTSDAQRATDPDESGVREVSREFLVPAKTDLAHPSPDAGVVDAARRAP